MKNAPLCIIYLFWCFCLCIFSFVSFVCVSFVKIITSLLRNVSVIDASLSLQLLTLSSFCANQYHLHDKYHLRENELRLREANAYLSSSLQVHCRHRQNYHHFKQHHNHNHHPHHNHNHHHHHHHYNHHNHHHHYHHHQHQHHQYH